MRLVIPSFTKANILVAGDVMLDRYWHGNTSRISPEAPVPVVKVSDIEDRPGGAGNVALNIASMGASSGILACVGEDEPAKTLESYLLSQNVQCHFVPVPNSHTVTKLRVLSRNQQLIRLDFENGFLTPETDTVEKKLDALLSSHNGLILSDYSKGTLENIPNLIKKARQKNIPVFIDPKGNDFSIYENATLITPNQTEFEAVVGVCRTEQELIEKGERLRESLNLDALLVTRSEKGMALFERDQSVFMQETQAKEVYDVTGAGDTVIATVAAAVCSGEPFKQAVQLANLAAGIVVSKVGTATASVTELKTALAKQGLGVASALDQHDAISMIKNAQSHQQKVVMTNGCFDILHPGHVAYLKEAARLGDRLIVAVNSDESVKRLKGPSRPINPLDHRMTMLGALECVDWVVPFTQDTPQNLIEQCLPDVLVKGGDYKVDEIAGADAVLKAGGEVKILQFLDGHSTTQIIEKINGD